ncbi:hypothetical protein SAMN05216323_100128 [Williamwhitmania taraxaci]|uniref:Uncharacterized protein n=1 Tax=Williamwhitmania taraxaci TaxID=1640674 RepID=A0A1G6GGH8_9BACT|nr:hypothetical protein SAMN05216323_100128 [Williamwhitmania taraxaci]
MYQICRVLTDYLWILSAYCLIEKLTHSPISFLSNYDFFTIFSHFYQSIFRLICFNKTYVHQPSVTDRAKL